MRIAFDHQAFSWQEYGGVSRYLYELARELASHQGQEVSIVSPLYVNRYLRQEAQHAFKLWGIPVHHISRTDWLMRIANSLLVGPLIVRPVLKKLEPDIVHETYYSRFRFAPKNAKVVLTVYDMVHELFPEAFSALTPTRREKAAAVERADHIICISQQTRRDLIELLDVDPAKTSVVYLGFSRMAVQPKMCAEIQGRPYLLYVGVRGGYKNFAGMLRAVAASPALRKDYRIICFGGGPLSGKEQALAAQLGYADGDVLQVSGSDAVLAGLYQHARAFIYPSLYEGFGIPPLEAMSFDCPVACSSVSSIPEVVGDAAAYFDPSSTEDMRTIIEWVATDEALRKRLVAAGREQIKTFSWARCAEETLAVYRKVSG